VKKPRPPRSTAAVATKTGHRARAIRATVRGAEREPRGARRKRETREKLLEAAFRLMAERGMDAVAINEITEAADVGFGSFYNHFESKEAIYLAVMDVVFEDFADALDRLVKDAEDPAEVISICVRHTILRTRREPLWGQLLVREGISARALSRGLGARLMRDIQGGIAKGRLKAPDPMMSLIAVGGGVLGAVSAELLLARGEGRALKALDQDTDNIPERAAAVLLGNLGLPFDEAMRIAQRPLPAVDPASTLT
jgi:AcrR family transcriptional regulator